MLRIFTMVLIGSLTFLLTSCGGTRQFTKGEYDDLSEVRHLDDKFNESDMRIIADSLAGSLAESHTVKNSKIPPVVLITMTKNRTQEHIDMKSLTDKMRVALGKTGRIAFTQKEIRGEIAKELDYQAGKYVDPKTARRLGKQVGAQYFLTGELTDRVQEVGSKKYVYYKATFNLIGIESALIRWSDEKEIRKFYKKRTVSP